MKTIFETFKKSIYNPVFYKDAEKESFSKILKYYAKAVAVLSLLTTVALGIYLVPQGVSFVKTRAPYLVKAYYPKELSVHIENGTASANVQMLYVVSLKSFSKATTTGAIQNMLVINTNEEFDIKKFEDYSTYALLTKSSMVTLGNNGGITIQPLRTVPTITINQDTLLSWVTMVQNSLWWMVVLGLLMTFLFLFSGYIMYLIPLLLFALIPKLAAYIRKTPMSYSSAYKVSLYAIIPALVLKTMFNIAGVLFLPEYFTLLVFMLIIAINMREESVPTLFENSK